MDEEDVVGPATPQPPTHVEQMLHYANLFSYFIAIYLLCYLLCRLINWSRLGRAHAAIQGAVLIVVTAAIFSFWGLRFSRIVGEYDYVKAYGIAFLSLIVAIVGSFHGEHGRIRSSRRKMALDAEPDELSAQEPLPEV
jgi:hypothetical protein